MLRIWKEFQIQTEMQYHLHNTGIHGAPWLASWMHIGLMLSIKIYNKIVLLMSLGVQRAATTEYLSNHRIFEITGKQSTKKWSGGILKK